jgi:hypothetical protein
MERIDLFKQFWKHNYPYIAMELTDDEIFDFIQENATIALACNAAADYLLSQGFADVQE